MTLDKYEAKFLSAPAKEKNEARELQEEDSSSLRKSARIRMKNKKEEEEEEEEDKAEEAEEEVDKEEIMEVLSSAVAAAVGENVQEEDMEEEEVQVLFNEGGDASVVMQTDGGVSLMEEEDGEDIGEEEQEVCFLLKSRAEYICRLIQCQHLRSWYDGCVYACRVCQEKFPGQQEAERHAGEEHGEERCLQFFQNLFFNL